MVPIFVQNRQAKTRQHRNFYKLHNRSVSQRSKGMQRYREGFLKKTDKLDDQFACAPTNFYRRKYITINTPY